MIMLKFFTVAGQIAATSTFTDLSMFMLVGEVVYIEINNQLTLILIIVLPIKFAIGMAVAYFCVVFM